MINLKSLFAIGALAAGLSLVAAPALSAPLYPYGYQAPQVQQTPQLEEDADAVEMPARFKRQVVAYSGSEAPGTVIVDTPNTYLYFVLGGGRAIRYGIGVGREGFTWSGVQQISKKSEWPDWHPPADMLARQPYLPRFMAGGPGNPLGARAMYLGSSIYRIHGTNNPSTIGGRVSSGCIRMTNDDVADLYSRVNVGTKVVVKPMDRRAEAN
jgi:lipoprotein-anchoring transpeptidase ErfK/SrfK